jgi:hypothetical protein
LGGPPRKLSTKSGITTCHWSASQPRDAASEAKIALDAPSKPDYMSEFEFEKLKAVTSPNFYSAIAVDDAAKRDYSGAIDNFTLELKALGECEGNGIGHGAG